VSAFAWRLRAHAFPAGSAAPWFALLAAALVAATALAVSIGTSAVPFSDLLRALFSGPETLPPSITLVRLPRIACGALVGAALAVSGAVLQTAVRNPLADPGIIGVTAGAGLAALVAILFFPEELALVPVLAFAGGLAAIATVLALGFRSGRLGGPLRLVLSGVGVQAICFAGASLLSFLFADRAPAFAAFVVGSLNGLGWTDVLRVSVPVLLGLAISFATARRLDLLLLDDATAGALGVSVRRARLLASALAALLAAAAVSVAGLVAFVGLVVPNGVRLLVGPSHARLLPLCALAGAVLVLCADGAARTLVAPIELPVGALLALIGGPYFLVVLWRKVA
jgi:iron complex transport system permease protein